jgi:hypothetical protein
MEGCLSDNLCLGPFCGSGVDWLQLLVTLAIASVDLYVVFVVFFRQIIGPVPRHLRPRLGDALRDFAEGQVDSDFAVSKVITLNGHRYVATDNCDGTYSLRLL